MTPIRFLRILPVLPVTLVIGLAHAHETETCLMQVAQAATQLQACLVQKTAETECDASQQKLDRFRQRCLEQQHPAEFVERAVRYGQSEVEGDPDRSPYEQQVAANRWKQSQIAPNIALFAEVFPQFEAYKPLLEEHFATPQCPAGYHGRADRWVFLGDSVMLRYDIGGKNGEPLSPSQHVRHLFAQEQPGQCYPVSSQDGTGPVRIVNVPEVVVQELAKNGQVVRCLSSDCAPERDTLAQAYRRYQGAFREYRQLMICVDVERRNQRRQLTKGFGAAPVAVPEYCPDKDVETSYLNARGLVEDLDMRLFSDRTGQIEAANLSPD